MSRTFVYFVSFCALALSCAGATANHRPKRPNIVFLMADNLRHDLLGCAGNNIIQTPNIDRLAAQGVRFENAFCTNAICAPSRACVITGQYPHTNRVYDLRQAIEPERQFLPIEMKKAGYQTAMIGKWHLKEEPGGFDFYTVLLLLG